MSSRILKTFLFAYVLSACTSHPGKWRKLDIALGAAYVAASVVDWHQTTKNGGVIDQCLETNPAIGQCGQRFPVNWYFPIVLTYTIGLGAVLDDNYKTAYFAALAAMEGTVVWNNHTAGTPDIGF